MAENKKEERGIVPVHAEVIETTEDFITIAQRRFEFVGKLIEMSLKRTNAQDWVNEQGKPWLICSGAEKIARLFGVKLSDLNQRKDWAEDTVGRYYIYVTTGRASLPNNFDSIEAMGTCSQRDKFFAWETIYKDGKKAGGKWKDTGDFDETNVMKASYTNFVVNAITHLLGLRNLTWEQLEKAGIDIKKIQEVKYKTARPENTETKPQGKPSESTQKPQESSKVEVPGPNPPEALGSALKPGEGGGKPPIKNPAPGSEEKTQDQKKEEIWGICMEVGGSDQEAGYQLGKLSYFKDEQGGDHQLNNKDELMKIKSLRWTNRLLHMAHELKAAHGQDQPPDDGVPF